MEEPEGGGDEPPFDTRTSRMLLLASIAIPLLCLLGLFLASAFTISGGSAWTGGRAGPRIPVSPALARQILIGVGVAFLAVLAIQLARWGRQAWRAPRAPVAHADAGLEAGERVAWEGRPGRRSLTGPRILLLSLAASAPLLFGAWLWAALAGAGAWQVKVFGALFPIFLFFGSVLPGMIAARRTLRSWVFDLFGRVVVTDRRIAWLTPGRGAIYREIPGGEIVAAALIEQSVRHCWVAVTREAQATVREHDLFGLPDPERAVAAIEALSRKRRQGVFSGEGS